MTPVVSVVLCTFNRAAMLERALRCLREQTAAPGDYEVVVVDNNSTDRTAEVIEQAARLAPITYVREPRQGLSFARNRGVRASCAEVVAFTDDDVCVAADWIETIRRAAGERPDAAWFGGRVLPIWPPIAPAWLGPSFWAPLALLDYGPAPIGLGGPDLRAAIGANLVVRRRALLTAGLFRTDVQRVADDVGSTEDHELQIRMARHGLRGVYVPQLVVRSPVDRGRMTRRYHRRWHAGHGRFFAAMREPSFEQSTRGHVLDVPAHVYRSFAEAVGQWAAASLTLDTTSAFQHELQARFLLGYARARIRERLASRRARHARRVAA